MGQQTGLQERLFYEFRLEDWVAVDHLLRKIDAVLDLSGLRRELAPFYSHTGRPSVDPELMIRMLLVGYCYGLRSERRLCEETHLNLAYRWCESAWNKDPDFGVIGIQSGPPGRRVHSGFRGGCGGQVGDAGSGDDCEDPSGVFRAEQTDQDDLPRATGVAESRAQGDPIGGDRVSLRAGPAAAAAD